MLKHIFSLCLKLYPQSFRQEFEDEMNAVFQQALAHARAQHIWAVIRLFLRELRDLPMNVVRAHGFARRVPRMIATSYRFVQVLMLVVLVPMIIASLCNFSQWGYWFTMPSLDPLTRDFATVEHVYYYDLDPGNSPGELVALNGNQSFAMQGYQGNNGGTRLPQWAKTRGATTVDTLDNEQLSALPQMIQQAVWSVDFIVNSQGIPYLAPVGYMVEGTDTNGETLVLISLIGVIADDHYRYHEGLFREQNNRLVLETTNEYRYDMAGIEFMQWPFWFGGAFILWVIVLYMARLTGKYLTTILPGTTRAREN